MAVAVLTTGILHQALPADFILGNGYAYSAAILVFLSVLIIGDPGRIDRRLPWLRVVTEVMLAFIAFINAFSAIRLVVDIVVNHGITNARQLLQIGAIIWVINVIAFALWFWDLDRGGAANRAAGAALPTPAFLFQEMSLPPEYADPAWYPQFVDYLAVAFNTAMAFGPADVSAIKRWAKSLMLVESVISLVIATLVVARAVGLL